MDEPMLKSGTWPNVAIEAGSDPHEVMKKYGVNEHTLRTACYDQEQRIKELEALAKDLYANANGFNFNGWEPYYDREFKRLGIEVD